MSSYFITNDEKVYTLPSDCSLSVGNTCETKEAKMNDGSKTSYAIATFAKQQVNTYSLQFTRSISDLNLTMDMTHIELMGDLYRWESLVGKTVKFTYCNIPFGSVIISDLNVSFTLDSTIGVTAITLGFNMQDNIVLTSKSNEKLNVRFE